MQYLIDLPDDLPQARAESLLSQLERTITTDGRFLFMRLPESVPDSEVAGIACQLRALIEVSANGGA